MHLGGRSRQQQGKVLLWGLEGSTWAGMGNPMHMFSWNLGFAVHKSVMEQLRPAVRVRSSRRGCQVLTRWVQGWIVARQFEVSVHDFTVVMGVVSLAPGLACTT